MLRHDVVDQENLSIRNFLLKNSKYIKGRVLDFGAGSQPYKELVENLESVYIYIAYDNENFPATRTLPNSQYKKELNGLKGSFDTVICTQVLQYTIDPLRIVDDVYDLLKNNGYVLLTYPTCWDEIEEEDCFRYTKAGIKKMFEMRGFKTIKNYTRHSVEVNGMKLNYGGGYVGRVD